MEAEALHGADVAALKAALKNKGVLEASLNAKHLLQMAKGEGGERQKRGELWQSEDAGGEGEGERRHGRRSER